LGISKVDFDATGQLLIIYSAFAKYYEKKWEYNEAVQQLFIDLKKAYDSVRREVLYNILIEFGITMNVVSLIKIEVRECLLSFGTKSFVFQFAIQKFKD